MDPTLKAFLFIVAVVLFAVDAVLRRSIQSAGLTAFSIPFAWDAIELA